jgi:hypothetical protein
MALAIATGCSRGPNSKFNLAGNWVGAAQPEIGVVRSTVPSSTLELRPDGSFTIKLRQQYDGDWRNNDYYLALTIRRITILSTAAEADREAASKKPTEFLLDIKDQGNRLVGSDDGELLSGGMVTFTRER